MSTLIIKRHHQSSASGSETKIYRFAMEQGHLTVGSSRKADLRLPKTSALQIEGIFEIGPKGWEYHSFSMTTEDSNLIIPVSQKTKIKIGDVTLEAEVSAERSRFSNSAAEAGTNTSNLNKQIILVYLRNKLAMSFTDLPNRKTNIEVYGRKIELNTVLSAKWIESMDGEFLIRQKSVEETDIKTFALPLKDLLPKEKQDQWIGGAIALTLLLAIVGSFVGPAPQEFVAENEAPKVTAPVLVKLTPPRQQVAQSKADQQIELKPGKASAALDRIKGLTAKISAKAGAFLEKSARMPSAIGPNGNVNAAAMGVGRLGGSSTDWNKMAGSKVAGQVGGSLSGGTGGGQLAAGATGASGVGLLEEEGDVSTGLDRELIAALIRKNIGHILYCYERSLSANPNLFGKVSVRFVIGASGKVETQKIGESTLRDGRVENCILDKVANWKFPEPKGGVQVVVTYPFLFKTTN